MSYLPIPVPPESRVPEWQLQILIALFVCNGLLVSMIGGVVVWASAMRPWVQGAENDPMVAAMAWGVGAFFLSLAALAFASSWGLHRRRDWGLTAGYIACAFQAIFFPVGTVLSALGLWVLRRTSFDATG